MNSSYHFAYIMGSVIAAIIAAVGMMIDSPVLYGVIPGVIGGVLAAVAAIRFVRMKTDLAGTIAAVCGFVYYQMSQAYPVTLPIFSAYIATIPIQDKIAGIVFSNLTTALLLVSFHAISGAFSGVIDALVLPPAATRRDRCDGTMFAGFIVIFGLVFLANALFGQVVLGSIKSIIYQRSAGENGDMAYSIADGAVGGSFANATLWAVSLFLLWLYLLRSRYRSVMMLLSPLVLIWAAGVALQGARTYLITLALALGVYTLGSPRTGKMAGLYALGGATVLFFLLQVSTIFRDTGLQSFDVHELSGHALDLQGNEGASSNMDGIEYFRTELLGRGVAPNFLTGFVRGIVERPIEGVLMIVPRSAFPWKPLDSSLSEFSLFYQNVRLGISSDEAWLGASPGLIGRELIRYGILGPVALFFWLGGILALADRLFDSGFESDFNRIGAALLTAFFVAEARDWVGIWFIPTLPGAIALAVVGYQAKQYLQLDPGSRPRSPAKPPAPKPEGSGTPRR